MVMALTLIAAAFIVFFNLTQPAYQDIQSIKGQAISREEFITGKREAIRQVQKLIQSFSDDLELQDAEAAVSISLPIEPKIPDALIQLSGLADLNNLTLRSATISEVAPRVQVQRTSSGEGETNPTTSSFIRPLSKVIFSLDLLGTYDDLKGFLRNLETNVRIFDVEQISLNPQIRTGQSQNLYQFNLKIAAHYQGQPK